MPPGMLVRVVPCQYEDARCDSAVCHGSSTRGLSRRASSAKQWLRHRCGDAAVVAFVSGECTRAASPCPCGSGACLPNGTLRAAVPLVAGQHMPVIQLGARRFSVFEWDIAICSAHGRGHQPRHVNGINFC